MVRKLGSLIRKLLAADTTVRTMCHLVWTKLLNRKDFLAKFSENLVAQLSVRTAHLHRPDGAQVYFS
jgi:hypothetical protein